jgi:hypothetical protein
LLTNIAARKAATDATIKESTQKAAEYQREQEARKLVADTLANISSGEYKNPGSQIEDPELEKEKAITANYGSILDTLKGANFSNRGPVQPGKTDAATNKALMDAVGKSGLDNASLAVLNRKPEEYFRAQTGQYSDVPVQKEVMADYEKQQELGGKWAAAEKKAEEDRAFRAGESEKDRQLRLEIAGMNRDNNKGKGQLFPDTPEGEQDLNDYVDRIADGDAAPDMKDLSSRGVAGAQARMRAQALMKKKYPEINLQQEITANAYWNNPNNQRQRQTMDVVTEQLPNLVKASEELKRLGMPFLDRKTLEARRATGDVAAANYLAALTVTVEDVAKGVAGGNSLTDDQLKLANEIIYKGGTPDQVIGLAGQIQKGVDSRKMTMYRRGGLQAKKYAEQDPWLSDAIRERIVSGKYDEPKEGVAESSALPEDKAKRLAELRAKKAAGTLGK